MEKKNWINLSKEEVRQELNTDFTKGLNQEEIQKRREKYGFNELKAKPKKSLIQKFLEEFKDFMIIVLIIAAIVSGIVGIRNGEGLTDTIIIMFVIIMNAIIGVIQENKAEKSLEALQKMSTHVAKVIRNEKIDVIPSKDLVPGDIVILETGDFVPADLRIIDAVNLKCQEAALTGESLPVEKISDTINEENVMLGDKKNMAFSSSLVTYGRGKGIVVETGMNTEVGKIAEMINESKDDETPLQIKLNNLGKTLGIVCIVLCVIIYVVGVLYGKEPLDMFMTAVSLAVAAIPEGLAAVSTIVLAIGVQRMAKQRAIVKKLPAVETLGSSSVICSDKTGTLTQNKMTVEKVFTNGNLFEISNIKNLDYEMDLLVKANMLCNDSKINKEGKVTGDPTENALVEMGLKLNYTQNIYNEFERTAEIPFDSERKLMTTVHKFNDKFIVFTKGGVDELLKISNSYSINGTIKTDLSEYNKIIQINNQQMAQKALRVLACGYKIVENVDNIENLEKDLIFIGMVGMIDPPREEVKEAVKKCVNAGIKTVMITGDHKITAMAIAKELGILKDEKEALTGADLEKMSDEELKNKVRSISVYARVSPEHKVRIVKAWQANGETVAMTGDGVNDAPALKNADIGCAMGVVGTDVAKEAADVILTDDNFSTIVSAVEEGRRIYDNILKAITFLLSSNIGEIVIIFVAIMITPLLCKIFEITNINALEPLLAIHILWINLVTDSLPALALAVDPPEDDLMKRKPLKNTKGIFTKGMTWRIIYQGIMVGLLSLIAFTIGLSSQGNDEYKIKVAQTMTFIVLAFSELTHVFNIRNNKMSIFKTNPFGNGKLNLAILVSATLMFIILLIPGFREIFGIVILPADKLFETILLVLAPIVIVELFKLFKINTINE